MNNNGYRTHWYYFAHIDSYWLIFNEIDDSRHNYSYDEQAKEDFPNEHAGLVFRQHSPPAVIANEPETEQVHNPAFNYIYTICENEFEPAPEHILAGFVRRTT